MKGARGKGGGYGGGAMPGRCTAYDSVSGQYDGCSCRGQGFSMHPGMGAGGRGGGGGGMMMMQGG